MYSPFRAGESETNVDVVIGVALEGGAWGCCYRLNPIRSSLARQTQVELLGRRSTDMAQERSNRGGQLTPEQAREGCRWIRLTVLAAVFQVWMMVAVVALLVPHLLSLCVALGAICSLAAPLLFRYLNGDVERRVVTNGAADGLVGFARSTRLPSSSGLSAPPR